MENTTEQEIFDVKLVCCPAFEELIEIALVSNWSESLIDTIKDEILNQVLCLACQLNLDLSQSKFYPQIRPRYERIKAELQYKKLKIQLRREFTGRDEPLVFSDADDQEGTYGDSGPWFLYS
jgi:hypothetical protein